MTRSISCIQYGDVSGRFTLESLLLILICLLDLKIDLDLGAVEQIVETSQVRAIADAINKLQSYMNGQRSMKVFYNFLYKHLIILSCIGGT